MFKANRVLAISFLITVVLFFTQKNAFGYDTGAGNDGANITEGKPVHQYITRQAINILENANAISQLNTYSKRADTDSIDRAGAVVYSSVSRYFLWGTVKADDLISGAAEEDSVKWPTQVIEDCNGDAVNGYFEHFWDPDIPRASGFNCNPDANTGDYNFGLPDPDVFLVNDQSILKNENSYSEHLDNFEMYFPRDSAYRLAKYLWDNKAIPSYRTNDKRQAYYWLGRIAHLLQDMTVPAHVHTRYHDPVINGNLSFGECGLYSGDCDYFEAHASTVYFNYNGNNCAGKYYKYEDLIQGFNWDSVYDISKQPDRPDIFNLFKLFWYTTQKTQYFASASEQGSNGINWVNGNSYFRPLNNPLNPQTFIPYHLWAQEYSGDLCIGQNVISQGIVEYLSDPKNLFNSLSREYSLSQLENALIPHAMKSVAGLYRLFWHTVNPVVTAFQVTPESLSQGNKVTINYTVSNNLGSGIGLKQVELWRATDTNGDGNPDWPSTPYKIILLSDLTNYSGSFSDTPPSVGSYWYGIHVVNNAGNWNDERNSSTDGIPGVFGPIKVTVTAPLPPSITLTSPNGGENWQAGTTKTITWTYTGNPGSYVKIELLKNGALNRTISSSVSKGSNGNGSYNWTIPSTQASGNDYTVRVTSTSNSSYKDTSDNPFTITGTGITVVSPNGGENWQVGTTKTIKWSYTGNPGYYVKIELLKGGLLNKTIVSSVPISSGSYSWPIPSNQTVGSDYKIRVTSTTNSTYKDTSDNNFTISASLPNLTPFQPSGWSDKIVISKVTGTTTDDSPLYTTDTLYVDWAVINNGSAATAATFYTALYVDGVQKTSWYTSPPLNVNYYAYVQDYSIGSLSEGTHTIKLVTDTTGAIAESSESDNEYTKTITVTLPPQAAIQLPDTGQTRCYDGSGNIIICPPPGDPLAQDGSYSINPLSYMDNGNGTVTDNNTGIMWQKQDDSAVYNWYQASGTYDAIYNPSSQDVCGELTTGSYTDWRLPTKKELITIVDYSIPYPGPTINPIFTNTKQSYYWSSTTSAYGPDLAWVVYFSSGGVNSYVKYFDGYVRCVRGGQYPAQNFTDNGNGTVTDNNTSLVWQQDEQGYMTWDSALPYCEGLSLGGNSDWRLPNIKELESLTDDTRYGPAIDTSFFPNAYASYYWSSTTSAYYPSSAWDVNFYYGIVYDYGKYYGYYVRCVRGGIVNPNQNPTISSIVANPSTVMVSGETSTVTCNASDPDGDPLTYSWTTTGGSISGAGLTVTWTAPNPIGVVGTVYKVTCNVTDGRGGSDSKDVSIVRGETILPNQNPVISSVMANPSFIICGQTSTITCNASDPDNDPLTYSWTTTKGTITGTGTTISLKAPYGLGGNITVTCTVSDGRGGSDSKSTVIGVGCGGEI